MPARNPDFWLTCSVGRDPTENQERKQLNQETTTKTLNFCLGIAWLLCSYSAVAAVADRFDYPIGNRGAYTEANDGDGWYVAQEFGEWNSSFSKYHLGEDWNAESGGNTDCGLPVYAVANGTIVYANIASGWGRVLIVRHTLPDGSQVESLYGHLGSFAKTSGDVARGDQIGTIGDGSEGGTTYPCHLHLEIRTTVCPNWGQPGPGYSTTAKPAGWTDPSDYIDSQRQVLGLNNGLVAYYPFGGNATDQSGNGNHGTIYGASLCADRFGRSNSAYSFNGINNYIALPASSALNPPQFTASAWVNLSQYYPRNGQQGALILSAYNGNLGGYFLFVDSDGKPDLRLHSSNYSADAHSDTAIATSTWNHVVGTYDGDTWKIFVNGQLHGSQTLNISFNYWSGVSPTIGSASWYSGDYLSGAVDDVRIYNRALSASEVILLYNTENGSSGPWITTQPTTQSARVGNNVALTVTAFGTPPLNYRWRFNGQDIAGATSATLTLTSVTAANSGGYSAVVWNAAGSVISAVAYLAVLTDGANGTQPAQPAGPSVPSPAPSQDSLVIVTHGWYPVWDLPTSRPQWMTDLCAALQTRVPANWAVVPYDWMFTAWTATPDQARFNARIIGQELGKRLAGMHLSQLHLIAHSAGAELIENAARVVRQQSSTTTIHCTFLDPFTGMAREARSYYGQSAHWADNYFVHDFAADVAPTLLILRPSLLGETEGPLDYAYNVDVSAAAPGAVSLPTYVSGGGITAGSTPAVGSTSPDHDSPCQFYLSTVQGTAPACPEAASYGFAFSQEAGGWANALTHPRDNEPPYGLCSSSTPSQNAAPVVTGSMLPLGGLPNATSAAGVNLFSGGGASLSTAAAIKGGIQPKDVGTAVWLAVGITITNNVNFVQFDAGFTDTNAAEGLLTLYWNTNQIGMLDERMDVVGLQTYRFTLPATVSGGSYTLSFRLDSFTNATSITVTNVATGFVGITQPIRLDIMSMGSNNAPTLKLTGPTGYNYLVQSSTNLVDWLPTALLVNTNGWVLFADPAVPNSRARFYRAVMP